MENLDKEVATSVPESAVEAAIEVFDLYRAFPIGKRLEATIAAARPHLVGSKADDNLHDESVRRDNSQDARDAERWREFCRQADVGLFPSALLDDAKYMGAGVLELHIDRAIQEQRQLRTIRAEKEAGK